MLLFDASEAEFRQNSFRGYFDIMDILFDVTVLVFKNLPTSAWWAQGRWISYMATAFS